MSQHRFPHLAQRLFNCPLAIHPAKAELVMAALADRFGVAHLFRGGGLEPLAFDQDDEADERFSRPGRDTPYEVIAGIAVIPVTGTLVAKLGCMRPYSGMTGYDGLRANLLMALEDTDVRGIVLDIDSPGGEVSGCFDLADLIHAARATKPIRSILTESAYSAAYAIASATSRIIVPRTGGVGSIGVVCMHTDLTGAMGKAGIKVTVIRHGARKMEGNPYEALSDEALSRIQGPVDAMGKLFIDTVARNRDLDPAAVRATEAGCFDGPNGVAQAVSEGFADQVLSPDDAFSEFAAELA